MTNSIRMEILKISYEIRSPDADRRAYTLADDLRIEAIACQSDKKRDRLLRMAEDCDKLREANKGKHRSDEGPTPEAVFQKNVAGVSDQIAKLHEKKIIDDDQHRAAMNIRYIVDATTRDVGFKTMNLAGVSVGAGQNDQEIERLSFMRHSLYLPWRYNIGPVETAHSLRVIVYDESIAQNAKLRRVRHETALQALKNNLDSWGRTERKLG